MKVITEIEVEDTVKRVVKCDPGYRFLSDEEWEDARKWIISCDGLERFTDERWQKGTECAAALPRHHYRIKLSPEIFTHTDGKRYEEFNPKIGDRLQEGDLARYDGPTGQWHEITCSWYALNGFRYARPLTQVYEGEVVEFKMPGCECENVIIVGNTVQSIETIYKSLTPGKRYKVVEVKS